LDALAHTAVPAHLLVAGEFWEDEQAYRDQIRRLGLEQRVTLDNRYITNEQLEPYFAAANALVLPDLSGSQSGVGMTAVHYGLPVIATAVGGLAETITDGESGLIVPPGDAAALARAIDRYVQDDLETPMRAGMAQARARLSWAALIRIIEELSNELAETRANRRARGPAADRHRGSRPSL
ncbi:hypothetical protein SE17_32540, partial [Kouleothrix aurantiaca]